jgi:hypothetical protein
MVLQLIGMGAAAAAGGFGQMANAASQKNKFHAEERTMDDPEFAQVLRRQAELGQGVQGPNIAAQTGRNQQALARNTARDQMTAVRGQQAAMSQDAANNAASVAASGRGATAGAARYQAANATATAAGSIAQQSAQTQQQIANTAQTTSRDIANNTATAASAENIERQKFNTDTKLKYAQQYQDYQKANLEAGIRADQMNAEVAAGNAQRGVNGSAGNQFAKGALGAISDKNAKDDKKKITEAEFARRWNQRRKEGIPGQTVILNADDRKEVVQAPQSKTWHVKDKDHLTDFDRMWAERRRQGIPARREVRVVSDIKAKEDVKKTGPMDLMKDSALKDLIMHYDGIREERAARREQGMAAGAAGNLAAMGAQSSAMQGAAAGAGAATSAGAASAAGMAGAAGAAGAAGGAAGIASAVGPGAVMLSDKDAKEDARKAFSKVEPYSYRYKEEDAKKMALQHSDPEAAYEELRKPREGIMAQDLASTPEGKEAVIKDETMDRLALDRDKSLSLALASVADLNDRIKKLETRKGK